MRLRTTRGAPPPSLRFLLEDGTYVHSRPCFSGRGDAIVFMRAPAGPDPRVTVNSDRSPWSLWTFPCGGGEPVLLFHDPSMGATRPDACRVTGRIAFTGIRDGRAELFLVDADGTNLRHIPVGDPPRTRVIYPSWFPDGDRIAITDYQRRQVLSVSVSSGRVEELTDPAAIAAGMASVRVGPGDDITMALAGQPPGGRFAPERNRIWLCTADSPPRPLDGALGRTPAWCPVGLRLALARPERRVFGSARSAVFLASPDPDEARPWRTTRLSPKGATAIHPKWSPAGDEIVLMATMPAGGRSGLAVMAV